MTLDEQISFCEEKIKNIKLKTEPQTFIDIKNSLEKQTAKQVTGKHYSIEEEDIETYGEDAMFGDCPTCRGLQNTVWNANYCGDCGQKLDWGNEVSDIENLEAEIQQYRAIGTVEECRKSVEICKFMIERNITPENMHEYMKFEDECVREGFTFKSLLEAREKQKEKKIETFNGQASCPNCKHLFGGMDVIKNLIAWDMPYCKMCGQRLDWSEEE